MANEVIIEEYASVGVRYPDGDYAPVVGKLLTTQILDIAEMSATFDERTTFIRVQSKGTAFWYKTGTAPAPAANTDGSRYLPADQYRDILITPGTDTKIKTAA